MITPVDATLSLVDAAEAPQGSSVAALGPYRSAPPRRLSSPRPDTIGVLHVINGEHYAGAERVQDLLGQQLPQFGFHVGYACVKPGQFAARRASQSAPLYETPMRSRFDLRPAWALASLVRRNGYRILHTHTPRTAMVGALAAKIAGVPLVHHAHGQTFVEVGNRWRSKVAAAVERLSVTSARKIIAVSPSVMKYLTQQGISEDRIAVVANGVPAPPAWPRHAQPRGPRDLWTLGTIALLRPRKGTEMLLDAVAELRQQGFNVRLRAVGAFETQNYEAEVKARAEALGLQGHVDWVGFSPQVSRQLAEMDLMVLPSLLAEGLPMVVLEAMASGVPPVGTRVDGITDVVRHEIDGLLCEPRSTDLAAQLARVVRGEVDWQRLSSEARKSHRQRYSDQGMAARLADVYRVVLQS